MYQLAHEHPMRTSFLARCLRRLFPRAIFEIEASAIVEAAAIRHSHSRIMPSVSKDKMWNRFGLDVDFSS